MDGHCVNLLNFMNNCSLFADEQVSNTFYFTFTVNANALKNGLRIRNVVPATEEEARRVLERMDAETMFS